MNTRVSVAMAVYNGEKYIRAQLDSIIPMLDFNDEIVVSLNPSIDNTRMILEEYINRDPRIKLFECSDLGVQANFNNAIEKASGKYIFLCDQDDVWINNKVQEVVVQFEKSNCQVIIHDGYIANANLEYDSYDTIFKKKNPKRGLIKNMVNNSYHGCCMAFQRSIKDIILPLPNGPFYHDFWIGMLCEIMKIKVSFLDLKLIIYRRHDTNQSELSSRKLRVKISERIWMAIALSKRIYRLWSEKYFR